MNKKNIGSNLEKNYYQMTLQNLGADYFKKKQAAARELHSRFGKGIKIPENVVEIVHDPSPDCGFSKGALIGNCAETLAIGAFTENTIVKYKDTQYQVVGLVRQQLKVVE